MLASTNVTADRQAFTVSGAGLGGASRTWTDLLSGRSVERKDGVVSTTLDPYEVVWLRPSG